MITGDSWHWDLAVVAIKHCDEGPKRYCIGPLTSRFPNDILKDMTLFIYWQKKESNKCSTHWSNKGAKVQKAQSPVTMIPALISVMRCAVFRLKMKLLSDSRFHFCCLIVISAAAVHRAQGDLGNVTKYLKNGTFRTQLCVLLICSYNSVSVSPDTRCHDKAPEF